MRAFRYITFLVALDLALIFGKKNCSIYRFCILTIYLPIFLFHLPRQGSVVAVIDMQFAENATDVTSDVVISQLPGSGQMGNLTYNPSTAAVSGAFISHRVSTMDGQRKSVNTPAGKGAFKSVKFRK